MGDDLERCSPPLQGRRVDRFGGEEHAAHRLLGQHAGGEATTAEDPDVHLGQSEGGAFGRDHEVGERDESEPASQGRAVHRGHHGEVTLAHAEQRPPGPPHRDVAADSGHRPELVDVVARAEDAALTGQHDHAHVLVVGQRVERRRDVLVHLPVDGVDLAPRELDECDTGLVHGDGEVPGGRGGGLHGCLSVVDCADGRSGPRRERTERDSR